MQKSLHTFALAVIAASACATANAANPNYYSNTNVLTGANQVAPLVNNGQGIVYGDIDTGIVPWIGFSSTYNGQGVNNIDTLNSASCLNGSCTSGLYNTDGNGHGTFTASQIVGAVLNFDGKGNGISGVAPAGKVVAVQVLNAQGSGTLTDVANGIRYAADHGAQVLNLSLGPNGTSSQQASFYNGLASAINYAASKNVYIVFAGGNSSTNLVGGLKLTGFTDAAIQRLMFVGATDSKLKIASYSNKPGTGNFVSTTGASTFYKNMWVMADGGTANFFSITDPVYGGSIANTGQCTGYVCISQSVGTSMAAPQGTGAIGLLLARWPVLISSGNAAKVLEQTAKDLGTAGIDTTYGSGFINLVAAFQPVGGLTASTTSGGSVPISTTSSSTVSGGAFGRMPGVAAALSNYTVFDSYSRDFRVNLSGLVSTVPYTSPATLALTAPKPSVHIAQMADGSRLAFGSIASDSASDFAHPQNTTKDSFVSFTSTDGSTFAAGTGSFPASASFADALWGTNSAYSGQAYNLGASSSLMNLSGGGSFLAYGAPVTHNTRMAMALSQTAYSTGIDNPSWSQSGTRGFGAGLSHQFTHYWTGSVTMSLLNEQNGLLGTRYDATGPLHFGSSNRSVSMGFSSAFELTSTTHLLFDGAIARTQGASFDNSLISSVSPVYAYSLGASLVQNDTFQKGDGLSFSLRAPLKVFSGSANLASTSVDAFGSPVITTQRVNLTPDGREIALSAGYEAKWNDNVSWNLTASGRKDADNIPGLNEANVLLRTKLSF